MRKDTTMNTEEFKGISFEDPRRQAEFERLLGAVATAEGERAPIAERHRQAERDLDTGGISDADFRAIDDRYIAANNKIAEAKRAVDAFLVANRDYKVQ
jgi:hypothetical protein